MEGAYDKENHLLHDWDAKEKDEEAKVQLFSSRSCTQ
jgi:hypothetical protein